MGKRTLKEVLQEEADAVSVERGSKFVPRVLLSKVASGKKQPKKKIKRKKIK